MTDRLRDAAKIIALAAIYLVVARAGLMLDAVAGFATLVWPPTGIALAALLRFGSRLWPGIALGAFVANALAGAPLPVALGIAAGNTLEALTAAYVLRQVVGFRGACDRLRDVFGLVFFGAAGSTMVSATIGVLCLFLGGIVAADHFVYTWRAWWVGDLIADLVVAPVLLAWSTERTVNDPRRRPVETVALGVGVVAVSLLIYGNPAGAEGATSILRQSYFFFPLLMWAALRFGQRETVTTTFIVAAIAVAGTAMGRGPFVGPLLHQSLFSLQTFMAVSAATFLVLAASISERRQAAAELRNAQEGLEMTVRARTLALTNANADLRQAEEALRNARDELELRVEERTAEIRNLLEDLENAVRARDALISIASHELRTPLSALQLQVHLVMRGLAKDSNGDPATVTLPSRFATIDRQVQRITRLVDNLLDVSRITAGKLQMEYENVDLTMVVREVISRFEEELRRAGRSVSLRGDAQVVGQWDRMRLEQIATNLLSNAVKYGQTQPIEVVVEDSGGTARLTVCDHGIGIAEKDQARIFERFERLVSGSQAGGFGLGLWIVREIVQALGGTVRVESELGVGTTFTVELPTRRLG